ncbi:sugar ABC transporter substrate-binding protein [Microbacterium foliorum]|uniref:Sugar ABC transporter substrate-binding protein n=1 Tax=Microbacterium foliorum TaxID=104336 RepID=A0A4Y5YT12_9MICO|nr:sugar ABC transporter substrate-binding protein [Microbacterium foliorum]QDE35575.1 sugar ABC transporter substrate-binding protein [Microbacterium foliorum]
MRRHIKPFIALAAVSALGISLAGCSTSGSGGSDDGGGTVTMWVRDSQSRFMQQLADAFNESHDTQVEITLITSGDYVQKFGTAAAGGDAPDIASLDLVYVPYFASVGALSDISDQWDGLEYKDDMSPGHVAQGVYEDGVYSVPFTADVSAMFYNKDLFRAAGLDPEAPPTTMEEVKAAAEAITATGDGNYGFAFSGACGGCNIFSMGPYVWAQGGDVLSEDGVDAKFDSDEVTSTLELYRDMWDAGAMPALVQSDGGSNAGDAFNQGKVGIYNWGTFFLSSLEEEATFDWGVAPIPGAEDGKIGSFAGGDNLTIPTGAKNPEGAWEFLEWATGEDAQALIAENGVMPTRLDLLEDLYISQDPRFQVFADALEVGRVPYSVIENEIINDPNGVWSTMIQESVFGPGSVADAQKKAQEAAQALLDDANS